MKIKRLIAFLALLSYVAVAPFICSAEEVGRLSPSGLVNDYAKVISPSAKAQISALLEEVKQKTGAEVAVVTVNTTSPETIEQFAVQLFEKWGIGQKGKDNGVLMLVAVKDRKARIEVGYGLEGALTDLKSKIIIDQLMIPSFRKGDYDLGIAKGAVMISNVISEEYGVKLEHKSRSLPQPVRRKKGSPLGTLLTFLFFILIFGFRFGTLFFFMSGSGGYWSGGGRGSFGGGFGGFGGGMSGGGGASGSW